MTITNISVDWGVDPRIVRIVDTANLAAITATGYVLTQDAAIQLIQNGEFQWVATDYILIAYADGEGFFTYDGVTGSFVAAATVPGSLSNTLPSGQVFVGSAGNIATPVAMSGDIAITNAGVTAIQAGVIVNADINASAAIAFSKLAALPSGQVLVGSAGNVATAVALSGDATVSNAGVVAIGSNKVVTGMLADNLLHYVAVPITAAQFNGMYAAPKLLVAAPGANKLLVLEQVQLLMTYVSANYAAGGVAAVQYDSTVNGAGLIASTTLAAAVFQAAASTGFVFNAGVVPETFSLCVNKGLYLSNITGAFTTGDSTFVAHIWYRMVPTV